MPRVDADRTAIVRTPAPARLAAHRAAPQTACFLIKALPRSRLEKMAPLLLKSRRPRRSPHNENWLDLPLVATPPSRGFSFSPGSFVDGPEIAAAWGSQFEPQP